MRADASISFLLHLLRKRPPHGARGRQKLFEIDGINGAELLELLENER